MNIYVIIIILAIIQGVSEFLPVSSSGHLLVLGNLLGMDLEENLTLGIMLHAGSLIAIVIYYFKTLWEILIKWQFKTMMLIVLGCVPAGIAGVILKKSGWYEDFCSDILLVGFCFLITAALLQLSNKPKLFTLKPGQTPVPFSRITWQQALQVGCMQILALLPGVSRSGSTITAGIIFGVDREAAAKFSFLMAIPLIAGASGLETLQLFQAGADSSHLSLFQIIFAVVLSAVVSYGALKLLINLVKRGKLAWFSWYLYAIGAAVIIWQIWEKLHV